MQKQPRQLSTAEYQMMLLQELQSKCRHKYIRLPAGFDDELDESYEVLSCVRCGHEKY